MPCYLAPRKSGKQNSEDQFLLTAHLPMKAATSRSASPGVACSASSSETAISSMLAGPAPTAASAAAAASGTAVLAGGAREAGSPPPAAGPVSWVTPPDSGASEPLQPLRPQVQQLLVSIVVLCRDGAADWLSWHRRACSLSLHSKRTKAAAAKLPSAAALRNIPVAALHPSLEQTDTHDIKLTYEMAAQLAVVAIHTPSEPAAGSGARHAASAGMRRHGFSWSAS